MKAPISVRLLVPLALAALPGTVLSASLYLSPASPAAPVGSTLAFDVRVNTDGQPVNAVQANLVYPAGDLQFVDVSNQGSAFGVTAQNTGGGGVVKIARGNIQPVTGDQLLATVHFRVLKAVPAPVTFDGGSAVVTSTDNSNVLTQAIGGTVAAQTAGKTPAAVTLKVTPRPTVTSASTPLPSPRPVIMPQSQPAPTFWQRVTRIVTTPWHWLRHWF